MEPEWAEKGRQTGVTGFFSTIHDSGWVGGFPIALAMLLTRVLFSGKFGAKKVEGKIEGNREVRDFDGNLE